MSTRFEQTNAARDTLEGLVDQHGVQRVVELLSEVCGEKSNHVRDNWQDEPLARRWYRMSALLDRTATRLRPDSIAAGGR